MKRILLVLALMMVMVAVALAGTAFAQVPLHAGCKGIENAIDKQKSLRPGVVNGHLEEVGKAHGCKV